MVNKKLEKNKKIKSGDNSDVYHHGNLREELLDIALEVLIEKGVSDISLREVAKRAGVSHGAPYRHFKDKNILLGSLARRGFNQLATELSNVISDYPGDPQKQLVEAGVVYVRLAIASPELTQLMFGGRIDGDCWDSIEEDVGENAFQSLLNIVINGLNADIYKNEDSMSIALACWTSMHGLAMLYSAGQLDISSDHFDPDSLSRMISDMLLYGLLK